MFRVRGCWRFSLKQTQKKTAGQSSPASSAARPGALPEKRRGTAPARESGLTSSRSIRCDKRPKEESFTRRVLFSAQFGFRWQFSARLFFQTKSRSVPVYASYFDETFGWKSSRNTGEKIYLFFVDAYERRFIPCASSSNFAREVRTLLADRKIAL